MSKAPSESKELDSSSKSSKKNTSNATSAHHKGLIGKFQNLFKSSNSTNSKKQQQQQQQSTSQSEKVTETAVTNPATEPAGADLKSANTVELINYQKKRFDSPTYNDSVK